MKKINLSKHLLICLTLNLSYANALFSEGLPINTNLNTDAAGPVNVTINDTSYEVSGFSWEDHFGASNIDNPEDFLAIPNVNELENQWIDIVSNTPWYGDSDLAASFSTYVKNNIFLCDPQSILGNQCAKSGPLFLYDIPEDGGFDLAVFDVDGIGQTEIVEGFGTNVASDLTFEEFLLLRFAIAKVAESTQTTLHTEWVQPYAAMQNIGLKSIDNNRDLVLAKAGQCNNYGWAIGDTDYCVYTNIKNKVSYVNGDTTRGSYGSAVFNGSINVEKTINDKWKAGVAYGMGSANLYDFDFSGTTANLDSSNNHYSFYAVKKVDDKFTLKGMVGGSVFDYKGKRNYLSTAATAGYESDGYTAGINGTWNLKKNIKNMKTPIRLKPTLGVAFAAHTQDGFSESGSGDLITVDPNQSESLLLKTGIGIDKQITMQQGWLLVPSLELNYEMDTYAGNNTRDIKGKVTGSSDASTSVEAKTFGKHRGSVKLGADFVINKDFMFNLNGECGLATYGDEISYGAGFKWIFG